MEWIVPLGFGLIVAAGVFGLGKLVMRQPPASRR